MTTKRRRTLLALTDGRAGNARQAEALASALGRRLGLDHRSAVATLRPGLAALPSAALTALGGGRMLYRDAPEAPDIVIGCGRRVAPLVARMRREGAFAAQILAPQMRASAFDMIVVPAHDRLRARNAVATLGALNDFSEARLEAAATAWAPRLGHIPHPRVAVLVGGPSKSTRFGVEAASRLVFGLRELAGAGAGLIITASRRTPPRLLDTLAAEVMGLGGWLWSGEGDNPYPAMLGLADATIVTADSVNMASEAAATGRPVFVSPVDRLSTKHRAFHDALASYGAARPFDGRLEDWRYQPLREAERVAALLAARLGAQ